MYSQAQSTLGSMLEKKSLLLLVDRGTTHTLCILIYHGYISQPNLLVD